jgi:serine/threonine protein kinase KIN1/2
MTRGFNGPPDPHLLRREPLRADELDRQVIRGMAGFEFGTEEDIERRLVSIIESEAYRRAVQYWESKRERPRIWSESLSNSSLAIAWDGAGAIGGQGGGNKLDAPSTPRKNKRFSGFDFYRRKLFSPASSPPSSPFASPSPSQSQLSNVSLSDINQKEPPDPTRGYHPLLSIYYLSREKLERDRVYGPGHFASSQLSLSPPQPAPEEIQAPPPSTSKQPVQLAIPSSPSTPQKTTGGADYSIRPSRLPAPESMHYSKMSYDTPVTPSPTAATFQQQQPRPRARDAGLPSPKPDRTPPSPSPITVGPDVAAGPPGPSATLPRAPPASTHRRSHSVSHRQSVPRGWASMFGGSSGGGGDVGEHGHLRVNVNGYEPPRTAGPELTTFAERMEEEQAAAEAEAEVETRSTPPEVILSPATPPASTGSALVRKFGSLLVGGGATVRGASDRTGKRTSILGSFGSPRPSVDMDGGVSEKEKEKEREKEKEKERKHTGSPLHDKTESPPTTLASGSTTAGDDAATPTVAVDSDVDKELSATGGISHSQTLPIHRRAATILDPQGHVKRHERRSSTGAALLSSVGGTIGRHRRPSTSYGTPTRRPSTSYGTPTGRPSTSHGTTAGRPSEPSRPFSENADMPEGDSPTRQQGRVNGAGTTGYELTDGEEEPGANATDKDFKPVFLKGLFRYVCVKSLSLAGGPYVYSI